MAEDISLRVTAKDDASRTLDEIIAKGEEIDSTPAVVKVTAVDEAGAVLATTEAQAEALDATPVVVETTVAGAASEELAALQTQVEELQTQVAALETELQGLGAAGTEAAAGVEATDAAAAGAGSSLLGVGAVVAGVAVGLGKIVGGFTSAALAAKNFSTATGTSVEDASRWVKVSEDLGVNAETTQGAIGRMNKNIGQGKIDLAEWGVTATDTDGRFVQVIQHLAGIKDASEQAAQGAQIFGKGWQSLAPIIAQAGTLEERFKEVNGTQVFTDQQAAQARKLDDDLNTLKNDAEGLAIQLGKTFVPLVDGVTKVLGPIAQVVGAAVQGQEKIQEAAKKKDPSFFEQMLGFVTGTSVDQFQFWVNKLDEATGGTGDRFKEVTKFTGDWGEVIDSNGHKLLNLSNACVDVTGKTDAYIESLKAADKAQGDADTSAQALDQALQNLNRSWEEGAQAQSAFASTFKAGLADGLATHTTYAAIEDDLGKLTDDLSKAGSEFKKTGDHVTTFSADGRKVLGDIDNLGTAIGTNLAQVLKDSGGNYDEVRSKAEDYRQQLIKQAEAAGASADSVQGYIELLHLTPAQVETTIKLSQEEEARQKLLILQGAISSLPKDVQLSVIASAAAGDYEGALKVVQDYAKAHPAQTDLDLGTTLATSAYDGWKSNVQAPANAPFVQLGVTTDTAQGEVSRFIRENSDHTITIRTQIVNPDGTISVSSSKFQMAGGQINESGIYTVGEAGRETVFLPRGASVRSAGETMTADAQRGGGTTIINQHIHAGFGTDRFAVERAVNKATRHSRRLAGIRD